MNAPNAEVLLRVWEQSHSAHPISRALDLLESALPQDGGRRWTDAPVGQRDEGLLEIYESLFGQCLESVTRCPKCNETLDVSFVTRDIRARSPAKATSKALTLRSRQCSIDYRLPTSADLLGVATIANADEAQTELLRRCIIEVRCGGKRKTPEQLPPEMIERLVVEMAKHDPGADIQVQLTCQSCKFVWNVCFDIISHLWDELDDWAQQLLADVNALARAYGWSEREILSLSATRRSHYIELTRA